MIGYKIGQISFNLGQFTPAYSLQRFQHDFTLPVIERSNVVNNLIPNGTLGVRDIGMQANWTTKSKIITTSLGLFNGYGIKEYRAKNKGFLINNKSEFNLKINKSKFKMGYSIAFRKADELAIPKLLANTLVYSGNDIRTNVFALFDSKYFALQGEYLSAELNKEMAYGYYVLTSLKYKKNELTFSYGKYHDLISTTKDTPNFQVGYNYSINSYKAKIFLDNNFQVENSKITNFQTSIQLQLFF